MKLIKRLKDDKKFRAMVIGLIVIVVLAFNNSTPKKMYSPQSECDTCGGILTECYKERCVEELGCVFFYSNLMVPGVSHTCSSGMDSGESIRQDDELIERYPTIYPLNMCKPDLVVIESEEPTFLGDRPVYKCVTKDVADLAGGALPTCNERETTIGRVVQDMGLFKDNCKSAYYSVIFGSAIIAFMVLGVVS